MSWSGGGQKLFWWHSPRNRCQIHCTQCIECCLVCASCFKNDNTTECIAFFFFFIHCPVFIDVFPFHRKENNNIFVDDLKEGEEKRPIPNPCRTFLEAFGCYPEIMDNIERVGFVKPTPIQVWAWNLGRLISTEEMMLKSTFLIWDKIVCISNI